MATFAILLALLGPGLAWRSAPLIVGFLIMLITAVAEISIASPRWLVVEESIAPISAVLIIGLGGERVNVFVFLWVAAVACGVLARGGRQHWVGRGVLLCSLALPVALRPGLTMGYAALVLTTIALLLTCGRVTEELRVLLNQARWDVDHDALTGALSRAAFNARLDAIVAVSVGNDELGLVVIDLDDFGAVNKRHGHAAGDALLTSVVSTISGQLGGDASICRLGGDEFAVFAPGADPDSVGRRIIDLLGAGFDGQPVVRASVGVASLPRDGTNAEAGLRAADIALRVAKHSGKQQFSRYEGQSMSDLGPRGARGALQRFIDGEGLTMVVQPIVHAATGEIHAFEALARFQSRGTSSPLHWLAMADEFGLRDELELSCFRAALELLATRPPQTLLSVNLSGGLLVDPRTLELLNAQPSVAGLIIEVTENSLVQDSDRLQLAIAHLTATGIRFAIDDVGAGYSGLRQMTVVRPTYVKLDRSLVKAIDDDPGRAALLRALTGYATEIDGYVVAEGVETESELTALVSLGIPLVQGYLFARPGPPWPTAGTEGREYPIAGLGQRHAADAAVVIEPQPAMDAAVVVAPVI